MEHVLVIGGTGMLKKTSIWLNKQGYHLSTIASRESSLAELEAELSFPQRFTPLMLDYRDEELLRSTIQKVQEEHGPFTKVISWISMAAPNALKIVIKETARVNKQGFYLYHVLGSRSKLEEVKRLVAPPQNCHYCQIKLGFILEEISSRWLTHDEISSGVIKGIQSSAPITIVGKLEPWAMRPQ